MIYGSIYRVACSRAVAQGEIRPLSAHRPCPSSVTATATGLSVSLRVILKTSSPRKEIQ